MRKTRTGWFLAACMGVASLGAQPARAVHVAPLLEVKAEITFRVVKTDRYQETFFVARDGTGVGSVSLQHSFFPWESDTSSLKAAPTPWWSSSGRSRPPRSASGAANASS